MKSTGVVRKVDELGRVVLPKELRDNFEIKEKTPLEIFVEGENIILKKHETSCTFCGGVEELQHFKGKFICSSCKSKIKEN